MSNNCYLLKKTNLIEFKMNVPPRIMDMLTVLLMLYIDQ